jgi:hypothetical protein
MEAIPNVAATVLSLAKNAERSLPWLARTTGISYKVVLGELKHQDREITIPHAVLYANAFGITLGELISGHVRSHPAEGRPARKAA